ncbi:MAG TPA: DMT family transporter [Anaerolineaceae bacterium]|jgi:drug/metabolite transporter (DMT)-like permease|nr:DMT family transporter [Anaerolineaceae bacterium]
MSNKDPLFITKTKVIFAVILWGGSFIATKMTVMEATPVAVVWLRFLIGLLCLFPIMLKKGMLKISSWKEVGEYIVLGFVGISLHQWLQSNGLVTSQASTTAWIVASTPLFMVLFGWLFLKEKLTPLSGLGVVLATLGVLTVVSGGDIAGLFQNGFGAPGDLLIMLSSPNWAIYSILLRKTLQREPAVKTTFFSILFGWLLTSVQFLVGAEWQSFATLSLSGWAGIFYLGIFCTFLAYIFYYDALQKLPSASVGAYLYLEPIATTLMASAVFHEPITLVSLLGGALILFGISLVNKITPREISSIEQV